MNELQKMWVKAYDEYIKAIKDSGQMVTQYRLADAKEHADKVLQSLVKLRGV